MILAIFNLSGAVESVMDLFMICIRDSANDIVAPFSILGGRLSWPGTLVDFRLRRCLSTFAL